MPAASATITGWNTSNVDVDERENAIDTLGTCADGSSGCIPIGEAGSSEVYDQPLNSDGSIPDGAVTNATIGFTSDEAFTPGIEIDNSFYTTGGPKPTQKDLDGCILASSSATCTSEFQSGKRIKQKLTGTEPVDLVFNIDPNGISGNPDADPDADSVYQVFGRLINTTGQSLDGFKLELGFGVGDDFIAASPDGGLSFADATQFVAPPDRFEAAATQFPFGLFGFADTNPNFLLDGFFDDERTGLNVTEIAAGGTMFSSTGADFFGNYQNIPGDYGVFGSWMDQASVPDGLFWDFDQDALTDDLLVAWQRPDGQWELRRTVGETCETVDSVETCTPGQTLDTYVVGTLAEIKAELVGAGADLADLGDPGPIEDLSNLNLNYAIALGDLTGSPLLTFDNTQPTFTLRTTVFPFQVAEVPLPAGAPLLVAGLAMFGFLRKRRMA